MIEVSMESQAEFKGCPTGDVRRNRRAARVVDQLVGSGGRSVAQTCGSFHEAKACYRLVGTEEVSHESLLYQHRRNSADRARRSRVVLAVQDTTTFSFGHREAIEGMGPVDSALKVQGFFAHTALLVEPERGSILGVAAQEVWARSWVPHPKEETGEKRKRRARESEHWSRVQIGVAEAFGREVTSDGNRVAPGPEDPDVIAVFDREGDIFEAMETIQALGHGFVIRAIRNRKLSAPVSEEEFSLRAVEQAPELGRVSFEIPRKPGQSSRAATFAVRGMTMTIRPPKNRGRRGDPLSVGMVLLQETEAPPSGEAPLCWYLLTTEPCDTLAAALRVVQYYRHRWKVEEFHMGMKTGCSIEHAQFETMHSFENFLALVTISSWKILLLRDEARSGRETLSVDVLTSTQQSILRSKFPKLPSTPTAREWMRAVAMLGGFFGRKSDGEPGWRTLWWGWKRLLDLEQGWTLAGQRCG